MNDLKSRYKAFRSWGRNAQSCLARAREATGYVKSKPYTYFNPAFSQGKWSVETYRFVENVDSTGLRLVGFADELNTWIRHKGWYTDREYCEGCMRGIVYQLPARNGQTLYLAGYADPDNDGCALLSMTLHTDKEEAARAADSIAESFAEKESEYREAWNAVQRAKDEADDARSEARDALEDLRALETCDSPRIKKKVRADWCEAWANYRKAMEALAASLDNNQGVTLADF